MEGPRIGSLCSGYGGLDLAVMDALGGHVAWHAQYDPADKHQYAARILDHHWPGVPNHGDITRADWFDAEPVDIITAGFPCQPVSNAGLQKGTADARWIWPAVAQAVRLLRPRLVVLENVAALVVRGLPVVAADLARDGYVGSWLCLRASDVGAPHQRNRIFILAHPADTHDLGRERHRNTRGRRPGPAHDDGQAVPDPGCHPRPQDQSDRAAAGRRGRTAADADRRGLAEHGELQAERNTLRSGVRQHACGCGPAAADTTGQRHGNAGAQSVARIPAAAVSGDPAPGFDFGPYAAAVARWERILGRPAPMPIDERGRLAPVFSEWMMGAPAGWVTDVPGIPRSAQLKALGNGVVRQQGAEAVRQVDDELGWPPPEHRSPRGTCPACRRDYALRGDGTILGHRTHGWDSPACPGSGQPPAKDGPG